MRLALLTFLLACAAMPARAQFVHTIGKDSFDSGTALALGPDGHVYTSGYYRGRLDFDPHPADSAMLTSTTGDGYLASYTSDGSFRWAFTVGSTTPVAESIEALTVTPAGDVCVTGTQPFGAIDFDPDPLQTASRLGKMFFACYARDGTFRHATSLAGLRNASFATGRGLVADGASTLYLTGSFQNQMDFDPDANADAFLQSLGADDAFVAAYEADGAFRFTRRIGGPGQEFGHSVALGPDDHLYVAGSLQDSTFFDTGTGDSLGVRGAGSFDAFLASYDAQGTLRFVHTFGHTGRDEILAVATDAAGAVYVAGEFTGTVDFDPDANAVEERTSEGNGSAFLASYTADGAFRFVVTLADDDPLRGGFSSAAALTVDAAGHITVTGSYGGSIDADPGPARLELNTKGGTNAFVVRYDAQGAFLDGFSFGDGQSLVGGTGVAVDGARAYVTGAFYGTADFDPGSGLDERTSGAQIDVFIARFDDAWATARTVDVAEDALTLEGPSLSPPAPNPFASRTTFTIEVPTTQPVRADLYDALGRRVATLYDGLLPGRAQRTLTVAGDRLAPGLYLVRLAGEHFTLTRPVVHVR